MTQEKYYYFLPETLDDFKSSYTNFLLNIATHKEPYKIIYKNNKNFPFLNITKFSDFVTAYKMQLHCVEGKFYYVGFIGTLTYYQLRELFIKQTLSKLNHDYVLAIFDFPPQETLLTKSEKEVLMLA